MDEFGSSIEEIKRDGFQVASKIPMFTDDDSPYGMAKAAAKCADGMADALKDINPDIFLITVDRIETIAAAQTGLLMNFPMAHIQGGEVTGTVDESIRHAVTKMSHIHFPATEDAGERIIAMGEKREHVHVVGCPYLDVIRTLEYKSKEELAEKYRFDPKRPLAIFTQHPVTTEYGRGKEQVRITIDALNGFEDIEVVALYSNADAGGRAIISEMRKNEHFHIYPNIDSQDYLGLMKYASVMVGNSSAGIREAPSFHLPVVNIGSRQNGRLRACNVIDVGYDKDMIVAALKKSLYDKEFKETVRKASNPYGDGYSAQRIVDILERVELTPGLIQKRITL
jgi:UDP-N-acetylglucosamine 2-epimerase (non-hydrolysing)/GDP/UDP-N,N'-diacetylbacillosamine 2-epimerase (hydrolysing)